MKAPTVIIGLGGIGAEICARIEKKMPLNAPDNGSVQFVIMDTDVNTIRELRRGGYRGIDIQLSDNKTVGKCRESLPGKGEAWYPVSDIFDRKSMTEGAGQQRAISRLALEYSVREHKLEPLFDAVRKLNELSLDASRQQTRFYIISSLAGGTGSGILLPVAMYLTRFIVRTFGDDLCVCKGFFILSDALDGVCLSSLEKRSLASNAYAALKELDAFMKLADGDHKQYPHMSMLLSDDVKAGYDEYRSSAYEYCFLFGLQSEGNGGVRSFVELKDTIANAVYLQACSPIHDRNSTREDNTVKQLSYKSIEEKTKSLRRFGSIGCGSLEYPYKELTEYYAMRWAKTVMEKQWQIYDTHYWNEEKAWREKKWAGKSGRMINRGDHYINEIINANSKDMLAHDIQTATMKQGEAPLWEGYLEELWRKICEQVDGTRADREKYNHVENNLCRLLNGIVGLKSSRKAKEEAYNKIHEFFEMLKGEILNLPQDLNNIMKKELFTLHPLKQDQPRADLEYWMKEEGSFIHPNAVRFMLYQLERAARQRMKQEEGRQTAEKTNFNAIASNKKQRGIWLWFGFNKRYVNKIKGYKNARNALYEYVKHSLYMELLEGCITYVRKLSRHYEEFYESYGKFLDRFSDECEILEDKFDQKQGTTTSFVCADSECREKTFMEMSGQSGFKQVSSELSYKIYELLQKSMKGQAKEEYIYKEIKDQWIGAVVSEYSGLLDRNIFMAMDAEERYRTGSALEAEGLKRKIEKAREILTTPFLQYDRQGDEQKKISICCYSDELKTAQKSNYKYKGILKWLEDRDGISDDTYCSKYELMFYHSFVGLNVPDIKGFYHGRQETKWDRNQNFKLYEQTIMEMGMGEGDSPSITPHTDKRWHSLLELPDTNSEYQRETELMITIAFLYMVLKKYIIKEGDWYILIWGELRKRYKHLIDCHEALYKNMGLAKTVIEDMELSLVRERGDERERLLKEIKEYKGAGILLVLVEYYQETELSWPNDHQVRMILESIDRLLYKTLEKEDDDMREKREERVKDLWMELFNEAKRANFQDDNRKKAVLTRIEHYYKEKNIFEVGRQSCSQ